MYKLPRKKLIGLRIITSVILFFAVISIAVAGFFVVYIRTPVKGLSMYPTLNLNYEQTNKRDIVYINRFAKVKVGDIVVLDLRSNKDFGNFAIKRLVATEGDIVNMQFDVVNMQYNFIVNGQIVEFRTYKDFGYNSYAVFTQYVDMHKGNNQRIKLDEHDNVEGVIVQEGEIFVLGDNWEVSKDSTTVGPISKNTIVGRVDIVVMSNQNEILSILKRIF